MLNNDILKNIGTITLNFTLRAVYAHGILGSLAFVVLFPLAALTIRVFNFKGLVWVHAGLQLFASAVALASFGLGVASATWQERLGEAHSIIGMLVIGLMFLQPFLGLAHHYIYVRSNRPTFWGKGHTWFGRGLILLGTINGGLGLQLANNTTKGEIAYGVIAGVMFLTYLGVILIGPRMRRKGRAESGTPENLVEKSASNPDESRGGQAA